MTAKRGTKFWLVVAVSSIATTLVVLLILFRLYQFGYIQFNYPSSYQYPIRGIDVSHHQGNIEWDKVAASKDVQFVYLKATEGGDFKDKKFAAHWAKLKTLGVKRGAYHFFTFCRPGLDQAKNYLSTVPLEVGTLPVAVDLEFLGNCKLRPDVDQLAKEVGDFVSEVQKSDPRVPIFYVTAAFKKAYLDGNEGKYPKHSLWVRDIFREPPNQQCNQWTFWQFAEQGLVDGIDTPVDLNVFCGTPEQLNTIVRN